MCILVMLLLGYVIILYFDFYLIYLVNKFYFEGEEYKCDNSLEVVICNIEVVDMIMVILWYCFDIVIYVI